MHADQRARAHDLLRSRGIHRALLANPATVTWLTGFAPPIQTGPSPFAGGPPLVWYDDGQFTLITMAGYATEAVPVIDYPGYAYETPVVSAERLDRIVRDLVGKSSAGAVGIEARHLPACLMPDLSIPVDGLLDPLRMVKTAGELDAMRKSFALTDIGHAAARAATQAGQREIDVWTAIKSAVERAAGQRVPLGNDCVASARENNIGGWPSSLALRAGDSLIVDLSVRWEGYWSDSCGVCYVTEPSERQKAVHRIVAQALEVAISLLRPGAISGDIDRKVRAFITDAGYAAYPHHTGHGIGVLPHEEPRIVPYNDIRLEAGMVLMLEPGIYISKEIAVRLEDAVLVTADGAEVLTRHDKGLP